MHRQIPGKAPLRFCVRMGENTVTPLAGYTLATRPWSFTMTAISVALGALVGLLAGSFSWAFFLLTVVGMIAIHGATNLINDYFDTKHGVDRPESPTAQYRPHPILTGQFRPAQILRAALLLYVAALAIGAYLAVVRGPVLLAFLGVGLIASVLYSGTGLRYKPRALGEVSVFLMWGPLTVCASYYIQARSWTGIETALLVSIPQGLWVALVLFANNLKDIGYDERTGVKTLAGLLGKPAARVVYLLAVVVIYGVVIVLVLVRVMPVWALATLASIPVSLGLALHLARVEEIPADADPRTAQAGMVFGLLLVGAYIAQNVLPIG
jgi:1,4-dihydroxy-2-naphthoate octaprenyltransferase